MKKAWNYYKIKWTSFFVTALILAMGLTTLYMMRPQSEAPAPTPDDEVKIPHNPSGHYSNQVFSRLIEDNLSELGFIKEIAFSGESEGHYAISGTLSDPKRLTAVCKELEPFEMLLGVLKGENVTVKGHIGEGEDGNGRFVVDTVTFSGHTLPAGIATSYIDEYTALNDLLEVPVSQIALSESGITFQEIPTAIQIASYK